MDNRIFIRGESTEEDPNIIRVSFQHFSPFDENDGLTDTQLKEGFLVDSIPDPTDCPMGKIPRLMYRIDTGELFYDYSLEAPAPTPTLDSVNAKLDLIMQSMLESEGIL